jgi:hypothetical protein
MNYTEFYYDLLKNSIINIDNEIKKSNGLYSLYMLLILFMAEQPLSQNSIEYNLKSIKADGLLNDISVLTKLKKIGLEVWLYESDPFSQKIPVQYIDAMFLTLYKKSKISMSDIYDYFDIMPTEIDIIEEKITPKGIAQFINLFNEQHTLWVEHRREEKKFIDYEEEYTGRTNYIPHPDEQHAQTPGEVASLSGKGTYEDAYVTKEKHEILYHSTGKYSLQYPIINELLNTKSKTFSKQILLELKKISIDLYKRFSHI